MKNFFNQAKKNYQECDKLKLDNDTTKQIQLDYFRMILLQNNTVDIFKFESWAKDNNIIGFYNIGKNDIAYLVSQNILKEDENNKGLFLFVENKQKTLFNFQKKFINRSTKRVATLASVANDDYYKELTQNKQDIFNDTVINNENGLMDYLTHISKLHNTNFGNSILTYLQAKEHNIDFSMLRTLAYWSNEKIGDKDIELNENAAPFYILVSTKDKMNSTHYQKSKLYDITQTNVTKEEIQLKRNVNIDSLVKKLEDSIKSSKYINDKMHIQYDSTLSAKEKAVILINNITNEYFFDITEQEMFKHIMFNSLSIDYTADVKIDDYTRMRLRNVVSTVNLLSNELMLDNIVYSNTLDEDFYVNLGKKDEILLSKQDQEKKLKTLVSEDRTNYQYGLDYSSIDLKGSYEIALEILKEESIDISTSYENLFLQTKKLSIKSGELDGLEFVLEAEISDKEVFEKVARTFLKDEIESLMRAKTLGLRNEFKRNGKLFSREHKNNIGQSSNRIPSKEMERNGEISDSVQMGDKSSTRSNESDKSDDGRGLQGTRSLGDSEQGTDLHLDKPSDKDVTKTHSSFKRFISDLKEDYPVLGTTSLYNILDDKSEYIKVRNTKTINGYIKVGDFSIFGVEYSGQTIEEFRSSIEKSETLKEYKDTYFLTVEEKKAIEINATRNEFLIEYKDGTHKKMFTATRKEALDEVNSKLTLMIREDEDLEYNLSRLEEFRFNYPIFEALEYEDIILTDNAMNIITVVNKNEYKENITKYEHLNEILASENIDDVRIGGMDYPTASTREFLLNADKLKKEIKNTIQESVSPIKNIKEYKYSNYFEAATFGKFEHTKTHDILDTMVLADKLNRNEFKEVSKYCSREKIGYYSRVARAFIITNNEFLEQYSPSSVQNEVIEVDLAIADVANYNEITKIGVAWTEVGYENIEFNSIESLQENFLGSGVEHLDISKKCKLSFTFENSENDQYFLEPEITIGNKDGEFNPYNDDLARYLTSKYKDAFKQEGLNFDFVNSPFVRKASAKLIKNAEFIKNKTGLEYEIKHHQSATFVANGIVHDVGEDGKCSRFFDAIGKYETWSIKERWLSSTNSRKATVESISNELVEEKAKVLKNIEDEPKIDSELRTRKHEVSNLLMEELGAIGLRSQDEKNATFKGKIVSTFNEKGNYTTAISYFGVKDDLKDINGLISNITKSYEFKDFLVELEKKSESLGSNDFLNQIESISQSSEDNQNDFLNNNLELVKKHKNEISDFLDRKISGRTNALARELGFIESLTNYTETDIANWLKYAKFEKNDNGTNNVAVSIFGIEDTFEDLDTYLETIKKSNEYMVYNDSLLKSFDVNRIYNLIDDKTTSYHDFIKKENSIIEDLENTRKVSEYEIELSLMAGQRLILKRQYVDSEIAKALEYDSVELIEEVAEKLSSEFNDINTENKLDDLALRIIDLETMIDNDKDFTITNEEILKLYNQSEYGQISKEGLHYEIALSYNELFYDSEPDIFWSEVRKAIEADAYNGLTLNLWVTKPNEADGELIYQDKITSNDFNGLLPSFLSEKIEYKYGLNQRPPSIGAIPNGFKVVEDSYNDFRHGVVSYDKELSEDELNSFELVDLSNKHFENMKSVIANKMEKYGEKYLEEKNHVHFENRVKEISNEKFSTRIAPYRYNEMINAVRMDLNAKVGNKNNLSVTKTLFEAGILQKVQFNSKNIVFFNNKENKWIASEKEIDAINNYISENSDAIFETKMKQIALDFDSIQNIHHFDDTHKLYNELDADSSLLFKLNNKEIEKAFDWFEKNNEYRGYKAAIVYHQSVLEDKNTQIETADDFKHKILTFDLNDLDKAENSYILKYFAENIMNTTYKTNSFFKETIFDEIKQYKRLNRDYKEKNDTSKVSFLENVDKGVVNVTHASIPTDIANINMENGVITWLDLDFVEKEDEVSNAEIKTYSNFLKARANLINNTKEYFYGIGNINESSSVTYSIAANDSNEIDIHYNNDTIETFNISKLLNGEYANYLKNGYIEEIAKVTDLKYSTKFYTDYLKRNLSEKTPPKDLAGILKDKVSLDYSNGNTTSLVKDEVFASIIDNEMVFNKNSKFEYEIKKDTLIISNLKEFYSIDEIDNTFIKKQVQWEIFANKYIFDLKNEIHVDLLDGELNIIDRVFKVSDDYSKRNTELYIEYEDKINNIQTKKELTEVTYDVNNALTKDLLNQTEHSKLKEIIGFKFNELDKIANDTKSDSIEQFNTNIISIDDSAKIASLFGLNKELLDERLANANSDFNEYGKFDALFDTVSKEKTKLLFDEDVPAFKTRIKSYNLLRDYVINKEIDLTDYSSISLLATSNNDLENDSSHNIVTDENIPKSEEENFTIEDEISLGGAKTKFRNYMNGIEVVRKIEKDLPITKDERVILSKMNGVGTLSAAFIRSDGNATKGWENEAEELKATLTDIEYEEAQRAVLDAYYTDENITKAMWKAVENFGFKGGSIIEPSVGVGNFFGYMPKKLKSNTQLIGVELDGTTAKVAQALYPKSKIYNVGFEEFQLPKQHKANLVIGNPPYGSHKISDKKNPELDGMAIHNYFMGKSLDSLEYGGIIAMVVSSNFLDSKDTNARAYMGKTANLVGAIRLPKGSFGNANTEVVTDIVFFQKSYTSKTNINEWLNIGEINDTPINTYYENNQRNLLGTWGKFGSMYRGDTPALIAPKGQDTTKLLNKAIDSISFGNKIINDTFGEDNLLKDILQEQSGDTMTTDARVNTFFINDDKIHMRYPDINGESVVEQVTTKVNSKNEEVELKEKEIEKIKGMIGISNVANKLKVAQLDRNIKEDVLHDIRTELNNVYDEFVKNYGFLSNNINKSLFEDDVNSSLLLALEKKYEKGLSKATAKKHGINPIKESAAKADIFFKRTQRPYQMPTSAESYEDALLISLSEKTYVDIDYMSDLLGKNQEDIEKALSSKDLIYDDPNYGWVTAEEYLSGNVKQKFYQTDNPKNMEALEKVFPKDLDAVDISVSCGATWMEAKDIIDFANEILGNSNTSAVYTEYTATWNISNSIATRSKQDTYGTARVKANKVLDAALNNKQITVYDTIGSGADAKKVVNQDETAAANDKVDSVKEEWNNWIWADSDRRERISKYYNDNINVHAKREFDGSHLKFPNKISDSIISLRPHQKNAVWRSLQSGVVLLDHEVGSGKTFSSIASVAEWKRTGRAKKPLVVVPNHLVAQWGKEYLELYPSANILVPSKKDFSAKRRKILMAKIATGSYDAIIIAHSQLKTIENDKDFEAKLLKEEIAKIQKGIDEIRAEKGDIGGRTAAQLAKTKQNIEHKLSNLLSYEKDDNLTFSELGIDGIVVDEAHEFKNLQFHTTQARLKGLGNPTGSQKAFDLYVKTQNLLEITDGKNLIFLTGTPISNSIAELYTMQRYMMQKELNDSGFGHFDAWVKQNADITTDWELTASGKYKLQTRLAKFKNLPELMTNYLQFADVVDTEMIKEQLKKEGNRFNIPSVKGGKPEIHIVERSENQASYFGIEDKDGKYERGTLVYRSENLPKGKPQKGEDNALVIMSDARKASLDMRLIDPYYEDNKESKTNIAIENLIKNYKEWDDLKGTQFIFCDLSTPKSSSIKLRAKIEELREKAENGDDRAADELNKFSSDEIEAVFASFSVYDDIKAKLIEKGIPESEIAFIHDANTDKQKQDLFDKMNGGSVRFLLGSTMKMGTGVNANKRAVGLSQLDVPWRPSDLAQREGRVIRQGNLIFDLYRELHDANYNVAEYTKSKKYNNIIETLGLKGDSLKRVLAKAKEYGKEFEVEIHRYATKNTLDAGMWQKIETKAKFIAQAKKNDGLEREAEDISGEAANAAEIKAASSGNPLIEEEMNLNQDIKKLEAVKKNFMRTFFAREKSIVDLETNINLFDGRKEKFNKDVSDFNNYNNNIKEKQKAFNKKKESSKGKNKLEPVSDFEVILENGSIISKREDFGKYVLEKIKQSATSSRTLDVGTIGGMNISVESANRYNPNLFALILEGGYYQDNFTFNSNEQSPSGLGQRLMGSFRKIDMSYTNFLAAHEFDLTELPKLKLLPNEFPKEKELQLKKERHKVVIKELRQDNNKRNEDESVNDKDTQPSNIKTTNTWIDSNKDLSTNELINSSLKSLDLTVLNKIDYSYSSNCLVIENELDRKDFLAFKKIYEEFGGNWDRKKAAIDFSDDGIKRIKDLLVDTKEVFDTEHTNANEILKELNNKYIEKEKIS